MEKEIWKDIPNYEGYYQVSNLGRVKSLTRLVNRCNHSMNIKERILKQAIVPSGYYFVNLRIDKKSKTFLVHRLVALAFIENKLNKYSVNHIDCDKLNNKVSNLEWATLAENNKHANENNLINHSKGVNHHNSKLTEDQVLEIRKSNKPLKFFAKKFSMTVGAVDKVRRKVTYKSIK